MKQLSLFCHSGEESALPDIYSRLMKLLQTLETHSDTLNAYQMEQNVLYLLKYQEQRYRNEKQLKGHQY